MSHENAHETTRITRREALARAAVLLGGALSATTVAGVLAGCGDRARDPGRGAAGDAAGAAYRPRVLTAEQDTLVATLAEHILPRTSTPGARDVGVHQFIDAMLAESYPAAERALFLAGLADVDARARRAHGRRFLDCTAPEQHQVLAVIDQEAYAKPPGAAPDSAAARDARERTQPGAGETPLPPEVEPGAVQWVPGEARRPHQTALPFWRTMKELTLVGYYTSEAGATQELRYAAVPGRYEGCVPLAQVGRAWAV